MGRVLHRWNVMSRFTWMNKGDTGGADGAYPYIPFLVWLRWSGETGGKKRAVLPKDECKVVRPFFVLNAVCI